MEEKWISTTEIDGLWPYLKTLDWTESWLYCLLVFYVILACAIFFTRQYPAIQLTFFLPMLLIVYQAEPLNEYLAKNHILFTNHQYFDSSGLFISVVMSMPLLVLSAFIVANWFYVTTSLMREVRIRKEIIKNSSKKGKDQ